MSSFPYDAIVLASQRLAARHPAALAALRGSVSADQMRQLNLAVDLEHEAPATVARDFARRVLPPPEPSPRGEGE